MGQWRGGRMHGGRRPCVARRNACCDRPVGALTARERLESSRARPAALGGGRGGNQLPRRVGIRQGEKRSGGEREETPRERRETKRKSIQLPQGCQSFVVVLV
eukprot:scaffold179373_cov27-Tisochrysis_lutea.AAC.1